MTRRVYIGALGTETNQFVPFPTGLRGYQEHGIWRGDATKHPPTNFTAPVHVWRREAETRGWTVIEGLSTFAAPSGTTVRSVYEAFRDEILAGVKAAMPLDAVLINVHGAMVADGYDDCEGDLLAHVRAIVRPKVAIGAEFDLHCHLSALMLDSADVLVGYKEYPHTDTMERAAELFAIIADTVEGKVKPVMARHDCRMIAQYRTSVPPFSEFVTRMKSLEGKGIIEVRSGKGSVIKPLDGEQLELYFQRAIQIEGEAVIDILELRKGIEVQSAVLAAQRCTADEIAGLVQIVAEMRHNLHDPEAYVALDMAFHNQIAAMTRNAMIRTLVRALRVAINSSINESTMRKQTEEQLEHVQVGHEMILACLERGDAEKSGRAMTAHFADAVMLLVYGLGEGAQHPEMPQAASQ